MNETTDAMRKLMDRRLHEIDEEAAALRRAIGHLEEPRSARPHKNKGTTPKSRRPMTAPTTNIKSPADPKAPPTTRAPKPAAQATRPSSKDPSTKPKRKKNGPDPKATEHRPKERTSRKTPGTAAKAAPGPRRRSRNDATAPVPTAKRRKNGDGKKRTEA
jgi:hypothetical protein